MEVNRFKHIQYLTNEPPTLKFLFEACLNKDRGFNRRIGLVAWPAE